MSRNSSTSHRNFDDRPIDLLGQDFSYKSLKGACFRSVHSGVKHLWKVASLAIAHAIGHLIGFIAAMIGSFLLTPGLANQSTGVGSLIILAILWLMLWRRGIGRALAIVTGAVIIYGTLAGVVAIAFKPDGLNEGTLLLASTFPLLVGGMMGAIACHTGAKLVIGRWATALMTLGVVLNIPLVLNLGESHIAKTIQQAELIGALTIALLALMMLGLCWHISTLVLQGSRNHQVLRRLAIAWSSLGNTRFYGADLTKADFSGARLNGADFRKATFRYVNWRGAKGLEWARWGESGLSDLRVIELLTQSPDQKPGQSDQYCGVDLSFTDLAGANLQNLDLARADLTGANLRGAHLEGSNLTDVRAIGADFRGAHLTGACLQNWSIDASTCLDWVDCRYVYLLEQAKPGTDDRDRQPASGQFEPGDFARLYQTVVDTVDLIFRNGLDWKTFQASLEEVRRAYPNTNLTMQSVETKGDGYVVVKLQLEGGEDRAKLHQAIQRQYAEKLKAIKGVYRQTLQEKQSQLDYFQAQNQTLLGITEQLAQQPPQASAAAGPSVILTLPHGSLREGFTVFAQIRDASGALTRTQIGELEANPKLVQYYQRWQRLYQAQQPLFHDGFNIETPTNFSRVEFNQAAEAVLQEMNDWLGSATFLPVEQCLRAALDPKEQVTITVQVDDIAVQKLPLHCWRFFDDYPNAALTFSFLNTRAMPIARQERQKKRVLSVLGMAGGLDLEADRQILESMAGVEARFLVQPTVQELTETLWDSEGWDIFCFSGHSAFQGDRIWINEHESLSLDKMRYALREATQRGLSLSIFNCCQGIQLAQQFASVVSSEMVVMREPVPDEVAQLFLRYLVENLSSHKATVHALQGAREQLQGIEKQFSWVTWLPIMLGLSPRV